MVLLFVSWEHLGIPLGSRDVSFRWLACNIGRLPQSEAVRALKTELTRNLNLQNDVHNIKSNDECTPDVSGRFRFFKRMYEINTYKL